MNSLIILIIVIIICLICTVSNCCDEIDNDKEKFSAANCIEQCSRSHSQSGDNYVWLTPLGHGTVEKIEFEEPAGSGNWTIYTDQWWITHCSAVDHSVANLYKAHVDAFINPETKFANLRFTFSDNTVMAPTEQFYQLEADYFRSKSLCS